MVHLNVHLNWEQSAHGVYYNYNGYSFEVRAIRNERYKYVWNPQDINELYDLDSDSHEMTNLANRPETETIEQDLHTQLIVWLDKIGDDLPPPARPTFTRRHNHRDRRTRTITMRETLALDGNWQVIYDHDNKGRTLSLLHRENSIATRTWSRLQFLHTSKNSSKIMKVSPVMEKPSYSHLTSKTTPFAYTLKPSTIAQKSGATAKQSVHMKVDTSVLNFKSMTF